MVHSQQEYLMKYQPWKPWDQFGLLDKDTTDGERVGFIVSTIIVTGIFAGVCLWNNSVKNDNINDPAIVKKMINADKQGHVIYTAKDDRGLFTDNYEFIVAKNKADSTYANDERLDLGEFKDHKLIISERRHKGSGWKSPETMNYKMDK